MDGVEIIRRHDPDVEGMHAWSFRQSAVGNGGLEFAEYACTLAPEPDGRGGTRIPGCRARGRVTGAAVKALLDTEHEATAP